MDFIDKQHSWNNISLLSVQNSSGHPTQVVALVLGILLIIMNISFPSSLHSATLLFICDLTSAVISPVSPENNAMYPCALEFITSIS